MIQPDGDPSTLNLEGVGVVAVPFVENQLNGQISRRDFFLSVGFTAFLGFYGLLRDKNKDRVASREASELLNNALETGLRGQWREASVYAGLIVAGPGTNFYRDPALHEQLNIRNFEGIHRLVVLRPFFIGPTLNLQYGNLSEQEKEAVGRAPITAGTFAFWLPEIQNLAYCDFGRSAGSLQPVSRARITYGSDSGIGIPASTVEFDGYTQIGDKDYPYVVNSRPWRDEAFGEVSVNTEDMKLCGVSAWFTDRQVTSMLPHFLGSPTHEPVVVPAESN